MTKARLGRAERLLKRQVFQGAKRAQLIEAEARSVAYAGPANSQGYSGYRSGMVDMLKSNTHTRGIRVGYRSLRMTPKEFCK